MEPSAGQLPRGCIGLLGWLLAQTTVAVVYLVSYVQNPSMWTVEVFWEPQRGCSITQGADVKGSTLCRVRERRGYELATM